MVKNIFKFFIVSGVLWFAVHSIYIINDGLSNTKQNADLAVVFGNKVNTDGTLSPRLKARLDHAIKLYRKKQVKQIFVSGGLGKEGYWEGTEMKKYLAAHQIPLEIIITDNHGDNTEKTVVNSIKAADSLQYKSIVSISQYYHQTRIKKLFKRHHFNSISSSSPHYFEIRDGYSILREFPAYYF